jgi:hypothetical protein
VSDLAQPFQGNVSAFLQALQNATDRVEEAAEPAGPGHIRAAQDHGPPHPDHPLDDPPAPQHPAAHDTRRAPTHRRHAGVHVTISATLRPPERAYLMHYAFRIAREHLDPAQVPARAGVNIEWAHTNAQGQPDLAASRRAAEEMVRGYGIVYRPALASRHTQGLAIDMNITWSGTLVIRDRHDQEVTIASTPRTGAGNADLHRVGASYGVHKLASDPPHWSSDGR